MQGHHEAARLDALRKLDLLDTPPSEAFDRITRMAAQLFGLPIAAVSLTDHDRQWFKSRVGVEHKTIPRERAPCAQVADTSSVVVIPDLLADAVYQDSVLAHSGVRFYAGAPLTTRDGYALGAMCVLDMHPRQVTEAELRALGDLAAMVMSQIELQHAFGRVDPISGLANRNQLLEDLEDLHRDAPHDAARVMILIDLANAEEMSSMSRVLGTAPVDALVREAARSVGAALRRHTRLYHVASTQFALLVPDGMDAAAVVATITAELDADREVELSHHATTAAIGVAPFIVGETAPHDVLRMAHSAAEVARRTRSRASTYSSAEDRTHRRRFNLLNDFGAALDAPDQLRLVYQPRIDLASGACVGAEALLRWTHPTLGPVSPAEFIPIIERTSLARGTWAWVLAAALRQIRRWDHAGLRVQLSLNVSATNLAEADFASGILAGLARHGLAAGRIELEITESAIMENAGQALATLETIAAAGVRLAIDDFGTGYSSLSYLQRLPVHVVKIDQSFIHDIACDERMQSLVTTMVSLSHDLGHRVVAEGIETAAALECVRRTGCDEGQGYLFARPMEEARFLAWLAERARHEASMPGGARPSLVA